MSDLVRTLTPLPVQSVRWQPGARFWRGHLQRSEYGWALAMCAPYVAIFLAFVVYPIGFGVWMGSQPHLYAELVSDPIYLRTVVNTALFVGAAINLKMFCALLLSGFFMRRGWWTKALLMVFVLPWAMPAQPAFMSIHWLLNGEYGLLNNLIYQLFGVTAPDWLAMRWTALPAAMLSHIWKSLPFWTVILLAGRMAIPLEIRDAAMVDGANTFRAFVHVIFPMLRNLYLICTLLAMIFALGDFNPTFFVTGGGPASTTEVLSTLSIRYAFGIANPRLGVAAAISALPLLVPLVVILMRKFRRSQVQL
ncbi:MAG: carbohydrate ABC transporter permease [Thiohalocapsa sp.]